MNYTKWIEHFQRNRQNRPEPDWNATPTMAPSPRTGPPLEPGLIAASIWQTRFSCHECE